MLKRAFLVSTLLVPAAAPVHADYIYIDKQGVVRTEPFAKASEFVKEGIALVEKGGVKYFLDSTLVLRAFPPGTRYASREPREGLISFTLNNGLCGWVNLKGDIVIPARYASCGWFHDGKTYAREPGDKIGLIDSSGSWVVRPRFESRRDFSMDRMAVKIDGKWGVVDREMNLVIPAIYDEAREFSEGLLAVKLGNAWGYLALDGTVAIPFDSTLVLAGPFREGRAMIEVKTSKGNLRTFIDPAGTRITEPRFFNTSEFNDGVAWVREFYPREWGLLKADGSFAIPPKYQEPPRLYGNLQAVRAGDFYRFQDEQGNEVLKGWKITTIWGFTGGLFTVQYTDTTGHPRYAWITPAGKMVRDLPGPPHILSVGEFVCGLAPVELGPELHARIGGTLPNAWFPVIESESPRASKSGKAGARSSYLVYNLWKRSISISGSPEAYILRYAVVDGPAGLGLSEAERFIQRRHMGLSYSLVRRDLVPMPQEGAESYLVKTLHIGRYKQIKDSQVQMRDEGRYQF